jgi:2,4-dienoyl-CoA reductase-like NADH-dependent reductase (Old Yellow Enzyme family)
MMTTHGPRLPQARYLRYLEARARGGIGLAGFNLGPLGVMQFPFGPGRAGPDAQDLDGVPPHPLTVKGRAYYDAMIPTARAWAEAVAAHGVIPVAQLYHPGAAQHSDSFQPVVAASAVADPYERRTPHALSGREIADLTEAFALGARRAAQAGYPLVELHAAHGYLPQQFLSPLTNRRTDGYGGDFAGRARFLLELLAAVRGASGGPVGVRLTGPEGAGGLDLDDVVQTARALEAAGAAYVSLSGGTYAGLGRAGLERAYVASALEPPAPNRAAAAAVKRAVAIPVIVAGSIASLDLAESILGAGDADGVGMVRALMAEPELLAKGRAGRSAAIRPCIGGNECHYGRPVACAVNPAAGREAALEPASVVSVRRILVVGAGPAGIECALAAAGRGHEVTLVEQGDRIGGFLAVLARASQQARFGDYLAYAGAALAASEVRLQLAVRADAELVGAVGPDALVLACGAAWRASTGRLDAATALAQPERVGPRVAVVGGLDDHLPPLIVADRLARLGRHVTLLTEAPMAGQAVEAGSLFPLLRRLRLAEVEIRPLTAAGALEAGRLALTHVLTGEADILAGIDTVIDVDGRQPADDLAEALRSLVPELHVIGDALSPRRMLHATLDGARLGATVL